MRRALEWRLWLLTINVGVILCGCSGKPNSTSGGNAGQEVQVRLGEGDAPERGRLALLIATVHRDRRLSDEPPYYKDGGDWTFLECKAAADPNTAITVGVLADASSRSGPFTWGKALMIVEDREAGGRFVSLFRNAFTGAPPPPVDSNYKPRPLHVNTAVLGVDMKRAMEGGFSGKGGGWTATKWFPEFDGRAGEIYFNFNVAERKAEFSEKDGEYRNDLLAIFAGAMRDGPRPHRTPETDSNLTRVGPRIGTPRRLLPERSDHFAFCPNSRLAVYLKESTIRSVLPDDSNTKPVVLAKFDGVPVDVRVLNDQPDLLVQESIPQEPGARSSADPMRIWLVEASGQKRTLLRGPERHIDVDEAAASPDGRYIALTRWEGKPGSDERCRAVLIRDRVKGTEQEVRIPGAALTVVGWRHSDAGVRAVAVTNRWGFSGDESELFLVDPSTGRLELRADEDARYELNNFWSPDRKRRVRIEDRELVVTDVASREEIKFSFHEEDWPDISIECIEWASPRYVKFNGRRVSLIDVTTMRMCFPEMVQAGKFDSHSFKFSADMRFVLYQGEGPDGVGLFLAPVALPRER